MNDMELFEYHYAIICPDLQLFRFRTENDLKGFLSCNSNCALKYTDVSLTTGIEKAVWKPETDKLSGISYEWTTIWICAG